MVVEAVMTRDYRAETAASITALGRRIIETNLCKEIMLPMGYNICTLGHPNSLSKYKFSRAKWYVAEFDDKNYFEVEKWCEEQFGPHPKNPDAWCRWFHRYSEKIHFRDEKDYVFFMLRWGV